MGGQALADEFRYLHHDALGSVDTITDSHGDVIQRMRYDPFGTRKVTASNDPDLKAWTARGFTGHEHLDGLGLIHMNAWLYDPEIGRFLSPDIYIQAPDKSQNYNRYAYVINNPLKYTDPSGHFFNFIIGAVIALVSAQSDNKFIRTIGMTIGMALMGGAYGNSLFAGAGSIGNVAAAGFVQGYATTGSLTGAFREGFFSALSAGTAEFIGHGGLFNTLAGQTLAHGVAQGVISELRGGSFKSGFVGAVTGKSSGAVMGGFGGISPLAITLRTITAAVFGGLAAEATGGSFADGALSAALTHLFNDEADNLRLLGQGYDRNNVMGGINEYGDSLVYHPDHYDPAAASFILINGVSCLIPIAKISAFSLGNIRIIGRTVDLVDGNLRFGEKVLDFHVVFRADGSINQRATWYNNYRALRMAMNEGRPIRDLSPGNLDGKFLNLERMQLNSRGWRFDSESTYFYPPQ